jgi:hypothetical protein
MSVALYPVLERPDTGIDATVDGKALSRASDFLERLALSAGVTPLTEFISLESDDYGILEEASVELPATKWFSAADGLRTVRALLDGVRQTREGDGALLGDLHALENVLVQADETHVRWHLTIDM